MSNLLSSLANQSAASRAPGFMDLGGGSAPAMNPVSGDGIGSGVDARRLQREAQVRGYVAGYVMANAPAITMALSTKKVKDGEPIYNIIAKESKPSRTLAVLMALPARCVKKGGMLATPTEIMSGAVDFGTIGAEEMVYHAFAPSAAISYIAALGGKLPEYAPNVSDARQQWDAESILTNAPGVSFVRVHPTEIKSRSHTSQEKFRFSLKTTSGRRSLYTEGNHVCLRALEHMPVTCRSEAEAFALNEAAFGAWRYRHPKTASQDALTKAVNACQNQIWRKQYELDGTTHEGVGSIYFMVGNEETTERGVPAMRRQATYFPWWQTGDLRPASASRVERIVKRTLRPAEGDKKERMVTEPILYKDHPNHAMFKPYARFVDDIVKAGYLSEEKLLSMGGRNTRKTARQQSLSADQMNSLKSFLRREDVLMEIQAVQDEAADRSVLQEV